MLSSGSAAVSDDDSGCSADAEVGAPDPVADVSPFSLKSEMAASRAALAAAAGCGGSELVAMMGGVEVPRDGREKRADRTRSKEAQGRESKST